MALASTDDRAATAASPFLWPLALARQWSALFNLAPQVLTQPINPGWTLGNVINISEDNSHAPDTEREIVTRHSYGRELGRIMDALSVVVDSGVLDETRLDDCERERLDEFRALARDIEGIKTRAALKRVERIAQDLAYLQRRHPDEYARAQALLSRSG